MAAVEVTISGVMYDKMNRTMQSVVLIGEASLTGLSVGGGPIPPGSRPPGTGIWPNPPEGQAPIPSHPIAGVPGAPGYVPPGTGIWPNPPEGQAPLPSHPIALPGDPWWPKPPTEPPPDSSMPKPPPPEGGWGWHPEYGWGYFPGPSDPQPHST